ncbi:hypothetical protein OAF65_11760, partial [Verrucomicrobiales bacterium]|nr:hypothetical protein [Verrucomicrobiales bacterium]
EQLTLNHGSLVMVRGSWVMASHSPRCSSLDWGDQGSVTAHDQTWLPKLMAMSRRMFDELFPRA